MGTSLVPGKVVDSIFDLSPKALAQQGVRLVLTDLDNTIAAYDEALPSPALTAWKDALAAEGVALFVVSNSRKSRRCPRFCQALGVPWIRHAGKPGIRGIREALDRAGVPPEAAVMVGDQIFTDTLGANRAGIPSVLVRPIAWGKNPGRLLRYALELPFRYLGKRK